jgi:hypothetical protein
MKTNRNLIIVLTVVLAIIAGSTSSWAVKPENPGKPVKKAVLDSTVCTELSGTWDNNTCTIGENTTATATSGFTIPVQVTLVVNGALYVGLFDLGNPESEFNPQLIYEFSIDNSGTIAVHKSLFNLRTINNSGTITVDSSFINTDGYFDGICNAGAINNSGTITVENSTPTINGYAKITTGIFNLGGKIGTEEDTDFYFNAILTNEESGTIVINNSGFGSTGIENYGSISNFGTIKVNDLIYDDISSPPVGLNNMGLLINEISGSLDNLFGDQALNTIGIRNAGGTMVNYGTTNNDGAMATTGFIMLTYGTINNHGYLLQQGGELVNYGLVNNYGAIDATSQYNYPHNRGTCIDQLTYDASGAVIQVGTGCK